MLKSVPMGHSVDVVLRRGYPMLYNPDGCPKTSLASPSDPTSANPAAPGSAQTQVQHPDGHQTGLVNLNRSMSHHNNFYPRMQKEALDANGNTAPQPSYAMANGNGVGGTIGMGAVPSSNGPPPSERMSSSHSDTEVSSVVTRRCVHPSGPPGLSSLALPTGCVCLMLCRASSKTSHAAESLPICYFTQRLPEDLPNTYTDTYVAITKKNEQSQHCEEILDGVRESNTMGKFQTASRNIPVKGTDDECDSTTLKQAKCKNIMKAKTALALKAMAGNKEKVNVSPITGANNANVNSRLKAA
ncbi:membrane-associated guanylate WW and PDZ domain-containing 1-like isoform X1 [Labeo rohita]|uniref:Membrane-associated guanylate WW and PDZ domain-containing 1-like isoform X1 n=1 Tax=Labeo rohita TaxID=84645 RepID=A0A498NF41_LABRO|nr:membrane-associated guanylate WW and PDZ domain-containing 1-like isoform X1 [Labeo rohita]